MAELKDDGAPLVSAVVCTRGRGARVVATIESILSSDHDAFELVIIDQSSDDDTERAVKAFLGDHRVRYLRSTTVGKGRALNLALKVSSGELMAITDDDVTVPSNWLTVMGRAFTDRPLVAVAFCNVVAAPHDSAAGFIPGYERSGTVEVTTLWEKVHARGIGAGSAVRRSAIVSMGGFDPLLGPGGPLGSTDDRDVALRALLAGWHVYETDEVAVVHDGFRTWNEGRALTERDWLGLGTSCSKPIRVMRFDGVAIVLWEGIVMAILKPAVDTIRTRRPSGFKQGWYFWRGFVIGWRHPLDRTTMCFVAESP
jgi:GT2 family glycosyltransferase